MHNVLSRLDEERFLIRNWTAKYLEQILVIHLSDMVSEKEIEELGEKGKGKGLLFF